MARIRTIKPEFWTDEKIVQLPFEARLMFIGLWNFADDDGMLWDEPERIRMQILPSDAVDADLIIDLLVAAGLVDRWRTAEGSREFLSIVHFAEHQSISHKTASRIPLQGAKKASIPSAVRRAVAKKYGCQPGDQKDADCYYCGAPGFIFWWTIGKEAKPSSWVSFSRLELDHFKAESEGGSTDTDNIVLACRECNRSKHNRDGLTFLSGKIQSVPENPGVLQPEGKGMEGKAKPSPPYPPVPTGNDTDPGHAVGLAVLALLNWGTNQTKNCGVVHQWLADGADPERDIYPTIKAAVSSGTAKKVRSVKYFTGAVMDSVARHKEAPKPNGKHPPVDESTRLDAVAFKVKHPGMARPPIQDIQACLAAGKITQQEFEAAT